MRRRWLVVLLALMAGGGALVAIGSMDHHTDLSSVLEIWGDVLRDADQATLRATRLSDDAETRFGAELASRMVWAEDPVWTPYVASVGAALVPHVRRTGIRYQFHVVQSPQLNAFAIPGGHVYVFTGMLAFLKSEAELAAVLGHEISHVDLRHCIERYQYELAGRKVGLDQIGRLAEAARLPYTIGYQRYQEIEADEQGTRLSAQAGYDPSVAPALFTRMHKALGEPEWQRAATPVEEVAGALAGSMLGYFRSHPMSEERARRLSELVSRNRRHLRGRTLYEGVANFQQRVPRSQQEFPGERRTQGQK
jgi:predicted Zn-dependent protease